MDDSYEIKADEVAFEIDLAAEKLISADFANCKIAVEIKNFPISPNLSKFCTAFGQFLNDLDALSIC
jgi:hypothetical protein